MTWMSLLPAQINNISALGYMCPAVPGLAEIINPALLNNAVVAIIGGLISGLITLRVLETKFANSEEHRKTQDARLAALEAILMQSRIDHEKCKAESLSKYATHGEVVAVTREVVQRIEALREHVADNSENVFRRVDGSLAKVHERVNAVDSKVAAVQGVLMKSLKGEAL